MAKQIPRISITLPNGAAAEVGGPTTTKISGNIGVCQGNIAMVKVVTPNFTNPVTTTIRIYDRNGILLWTSAALAEASTATGYAIPVNIPISEKEYVTAQPSGDPGAGGGVVTIDMDYIPDNFMTL
jgi:hypothetical protein